MKLNWLLAPTLILSLLLYGTGKSLWPRLKTPAQRMTLLAFAALMAAPGFLVAFYYLHITGTGAWFYYFRALPFAELTAAGLGLFAGLLAASTQRSQAFVLTILCMMISLPHLKPLLAPISDNQFQTTWVQDVCIQSTPSSCGPASAATLLRLLGKDFTEKDIARKCYTYAGGTENWYIARLFREAGFGVEFYTGHITDALPVPSIAGVKLGTMGHFIPIMAQTEDTYVTGDPLVGRQEWPKADIREHFNFSGFFMKIQTNGEHVLAVDLRPEAGLKSTGLKGR